MDDEHHVHHGTGNKSGSSGYDSQPHSDHSSSLEKSSPPASKCMSNGGACTTPPSPSSGSLQGQPWLSPIKEGVIDVHQYCIPLPVWPGHNDRTYVYGGGGPADQRIPRVKCCRHCSRCKCNQIGGGTDNNGLPNGGGSFSGYSSAYGGSAGGTTISTGTTSSASGSGGTTGSCSDDACAPSSGSSSIKSNRSPLALDPRFGDGVGVNKALVNNWQCIDPRLNQKTDNLHYVSTHTIGITRGCLIAFTRSPVR